jgi:hypothetical protein
MAEAIDLADVVYSITARFPRSALRDKESGDGESTIAKAKSGTPNPKSRIPPPV